MSVDPAKPDPGSESSPDISSAGTPDARFQILALDGGGLRGIFAAAALAQLEADFESSVLGHFDLISGTSTGGLIALALAAGRSPQEILDFYLELGPKIFPRSSLRRISRLVRPYDPAPLREAVEEVLGAKTLGDSPVRLTIPAFDLTSDDVYVFRTPHLPKLRRDHRERMADVALATTAAPTYLPAHRIDGLRLVDGGVWANNPTMVAVVEALGSLRRSPQSVHVMSVGTTTPIVARNNRLDRGGVLRWARDIVDISFRGQALSGTNHASLLLPKGHVHRLDVPVPKGLHGLDRVDAQNLIGNAMSASRKASSSLDEFFTHAAPPYQREKGI